MVTEPIPEDSKSNKGKNWIQSILSWLYSRSGIRGKSLWDVLKLLIVPVLLAYLVFWFNDQTSKREREISRDNAQEEALQNYLNSMAELLLEKDLLENKDQLDAPVVDVAQVRTITTLRLLDVKRRDICNGPQNLDTF